MMPLETLVTCGLKLRMTSPDDIRAHNKNTNLFLHSVSTLPVDSFATRGQSMPRFYFDFEDGANIWRDGEGLDFSDHGDACLQMRLTMLEMARDLTSDGHQWNLTG